MAMQPGKYTAHALSIEFGITYHAAQRRLARVESVGEDHRGAKLYRLADAVPALLAISGDPKVVSFDESRTRKMHAEAVLAEHELAEVQAVMARVDTIDKRLERAFTAISAKLGALPVKAAPIIAPKDMVRARTILEQMVQELILELQSEDLGDEFAEDDLDGEAAA